VAGRSTLVGARPALSSTRVNRREHRDCRNRSCNKEGCRGAQLPGRPQREAHIPAERQEAGEASRVPAPDVDQGGASHPVGPPAQGPPQPVGLIWSVRDRTTFEALRRDGRRVRRGPITVTWLAGDPAEPPRVAYAIGRKAGGAVVRNRIRRRLRAIIREVGAQLRPGAYLFGATAAAASLSYGDLRATVCQALGALHRP
jgi:ribonuclease P protein component